MVEQSSVLGGAALRRIRRREGLTQAAMADRLDISPSYLNLLERNRRPISARLMVSLAEAFDFDPRDLRQEEQVGGIDGLRRRLADERFADLQIDREDVVEWLSAAPQAAVAFARLFDAGAAGGGSADQSPAIEVRREIERWRNHFADLDHAAEALADELRLSTSDLFAALSTRLREKHQLSVRIVPGEVIPGLVRRLDFHARQLQLSEMLPPHSRTFQLALEMAQLEARELLASLSEAGDFSSDQARTLYRRHLAGYYAAALIMPYGRFLRACEATRYDFAILERRFGVGFEQLAHRLTTLQRVGQRGLPFFMLRVDRAGQFSKRYVGASEADFLESEGSCPLWRLHHAFENGGRLATQHVAVQQVDGRETRWLTFSKRVERGSAGGDRPGEFVVGLGIAARLAESLAGARGLALADEGAERIGPACVRCPREDCLQRSLPPHGRTLRFERHTAPTTPFPLADSPV
ncbi:short-chain fatty acyl-CoA regulator family protein [Blastomonas marina]|uniref:helix-turn-helix domain-containing protein n=1 Tax=Blastomonas marina TaxID=1867408 RepID=UPI002AC94FB1|nr:short-chain fatty acyl-CoA regulator family protein [Blastomonas marina]WPZ04816.1 short-chain fatty acyl-CoA regulator family protein [Blastomonas marina]